ncbi:MAG: class I SAM-dependent methyltransferase, partial [Hyphomicrobiales bacterium]|nr:class I SAM-dependent methyltransferase [Hyphomicrobiales bacterium]
MRDAGIIPAELCGRRRVVNRLLKLILTRTIRRGTLEAIDAAGATHRFGDGTGTLVRIRFMTPADERKFALNPELQIGELYMSGGMRMEVGEIYDLIALSVANTHGMKLPLPLKVIRWLLHATRRLRQLNTPLKARRNVAHHYDLDGRLYDLFLDADRQYSCAYFRTTYDDLEEAQLAKKRHIAAKMVLKPGQKILDIGSGWGGLGIYLGEIAEVDVTGVTLSEEQHALSETRAADRGIDDHVRFRLQDYRHVSERFDRIVSVGMFEHVGVSHYRQFFRKIHDLLADDGVMLLHSIGRFDGPSYTSPWIAKYIFPGGYIPALSEVIPAIERAGLKITDIEILRLHYAETLRQWRERFMVHWDAAADLYDERFCR